MSGPLPRAPSRAAQTAPDSVADPHQRIRRNPGILGTCFIDRSVSGWSDVSCAPRQILSLRYIWLVRFINNLLNFLDVRRAVF
jgi:hypothetical protein